MVYVLAGVSGSGKTLIGTAVAQWLGLSFYDGDSFHPPGNVAKMSAGIPLDDTDREPWLRMLAGKIREWNVAGGAVLACSALKEQYRQTLCEGGPVTFVFLIAPKDVLGRRLCKRKGHFMPVSLLESQLKTLEISDDSLCVDATGDVDVVVERVLSLFGRHG